MEGVKESGVAGVRDVRGGIGALVVVIERAVEVVFVFVEFEDVVAR